MAGAPPWAPKQAPKEYAQVSSRGIDSRANPKLAKQLCKQGEKRVLKTGGMMPPLVEAKDLPPQRPNSQGPGSPLSPLSPAASNRHRSPSPDSAPPMWQPRSRRKSNLSSSSSSPEISTSADLASIGSMSSQDSPSSPKTPGGRKRRNIMGQIEMQSTEEQQIPIMKVSHRPKLEPSPPSSQATTRYNTEETLEDQLSAFGIGESQWDRQTTEDTMYSDFTLTSWSRQTSTDNTGVDPPGAVMQRRKSVGDMNILSVDPIEMLSQQKTRRKSVTALTGLPEISADGSLRSTPCAQDDKMGRPLTDLGERLSQRRKSFSDVSSLEKVLSPTALHGAGNWAARSRRTSLGSTGADIDAAASASKLMVPSAKSPEVQSTAAGSEDVAIIEKELSPTVLQGATGWAGRARRTSLGNTSAEIDAAASASRLIFPSARSAEVHPSAERSDNVSSVEKVLSPTALQGTSGWLGRARRRSLGNAGGAIDAAPSASKLMLASATSPEVEPTAKHACADESEMQVSRTLTEPNQLPSRAAAIEQNYQEVHHNLEMSSPTLPVRSAFSEQSAPNESQQKEPISPSTLRRIFSSPGLLAQKLFRGKKVASSG